MWLYVLMSRELGEGAAGDDADLTVRTTNRMMFAVASLMCWAGAVTTGRLLAYTARRILATW